LGKVRWNGPSLIPGTEWLHFLFGWEETRSTHFVYGSETPKVGSSTWQVGSMCRSLLMLLLLPMIDGTHVSVFLIFFLLSLSLSGHLHIYHYYVSHWYSIFYTTYIIMIVNM
jgi:hypothetical protein